MRRRVTVATVIGTLLLGLAAAAQEGFVLSGRVSATDQEADEGYFAIDQQTMLVVKPGSELHGFMRGQAGKRIRLIIEPAHDSE